MEDLIEIGKIVTTRGLKGELKIQPLLDNMNDFENIKKVYVEDVGDFCISKTNIHNGFVFAFFDTIDTIEKAVMLKDKYIFANKSALNIPQDAFFVADLLHCKAFVDDQCIGKIFEIEDYGASTFLTIFNKGKKTVITVVPNLIKKLDKQSSAVYFDKNILMEVMYED